MGFSDEFDECDGISSILWLFSGSSDNSVSVSYDCSSCSADIDWLLLCSFDYDKLFGCGGLLISCNLHESIRWYELSFLTKAYCLSCRKTFAGESFEVN